MIRHPCRWPVGVFEYSGKRYSIELINSIANRFYCLMYLKTTLHGTAGYTASVSKTNSMITMKKYPCRVSASSPPPSSHSLDLLL